MQYFLTIADNTIPEILFEVLRWAPRWTSRRGPWRTSRRGPWWGPRRGPRVWPVRRSPRVWPRPFSASRAIVRLVVVAVEVLEGVVVALLITVAGVFVLVRRDGRWPAKLGSRPVLQHDQGLQKRKSYAMFGPFGFLYSWFSVMVCLQISCTKPKHCLTCLLHPLTKMIYTIHRQ